MKIPVSKKGSLLHSSGQFGSVSSTACMPWQFWPGFLPSDGDLPCALIGSEAIISIHVFCRFEHPINSSSTSSESVICSVSLASGTPKLIYTLSGYPNARFRYFEQHL